MSPPSPPTLSYCSGTGNGAWWDTFGAGCQMLTCNLNEWYNSGTGQCTALTPVCQAGYFISAGGAPSSLTCYDPFTCAAAPCAYTSDVTCKGMTACTGTQWLATPATYTSDK